MSIMEARDYLVRKRIEAGLSQSDVARMRQCSQVFISKFETGDSVGWNALEAYASALGVKLSIEID